MGKELRCRDATLTNGIIISLSGFSEDVRKKAFEDNIILVGPNELRTSFRENGNKDMLDLLNSIRKI